LIQPERHACLVMTTEELEAEHDALLVEHRSLQAEHDVVHMLPLDVPHTSRTCGNSATT
jgi:hypothetical protein